jgi:acetyl-CoA acetyltransferase
VAKRTPLHEVAIVGAYNTRQARRLEGETDLRLTLDAVRGALAAAGLEADDVDGVNVQSPIWGLNAQQTVHQLGGRPSWTGSQMMGIAAVLEAAAAIATGQCETAVIASGQAGVYEDRRATAPWTRPSNEFVECWGLYTAAEFALIARRHMHLYGTKPEHLAEVAAAIRSNGARNPEAVYYGREVTPNDVLSSRMIADPFHLLDCSTTSEGGAAVVLTTAARARDLDVRPVYFLGGALERQGQAYVTAPVWDRYGWSGREAARKAFAQAGITPRDVDVCEFYDPFSFEVIRQFEAYGFCEEGEGEPFIMDGRIRLGGDYPVATNGGLLSYSHAGVAQLLQKVISATHQLQGRMGDLQVPNAKVAMATNGGAGALFTDVLLLGSEQP